MRNIFIRIGTTIVYLIRKWMMNRRSNKYKDKILYLADKTEIDKDGAIVCFKNRKYVVVIKDGIVKELDQYI